MQTATGPHTIAAGNTEAHEAPGRDRLLRRAAVWHLDGDLEAAEAAYLDLLTRNAKDAPTLNNLGLLRTQCGDGPGALAAYDAIGPTETLSPTALVNKANAHLLAEDVPAAIGLLQRAITLDLDSPAWAVLGQAHLLAGDVDAAETALRRAHELLPPRPDVLRSYAACLAHRGELGHAAELLSTALDLDETDASTWRQFGLVLLGMQDFGSAASATRRAADLEPDDVPTLRQLAVCLVALGRGPEAAGELDRALKLSQAPDLLVDRAVLHLADGENQEAIALLTEGLPQDTTGRARLHLGYAHLAAGDVPAAVEHLTAAAELTGEVAAEAASVLRQVTE